MIQLEGVTKSFGGTVAVDDLSTTFEEGRTHVLLGSSGCGKSTLLRLILGLLEADRGAIRVDGRLMEPAARVALLEKMGYVVQEGGLYPHLTARRNVSLGAEARGWGGERVRARVDQLAELVGFDEPILGLYPTELSGGQRQRVSLMRALMLDPPILLLDEPLGSLDPLVRADLQRQLKQIFASLGKTVVLVTHDIREAAVLGHSITLMTEGRVVQRGSFTDLSARPASPFVTAFLSAQQPTEDTQNV
jgi:osmoprotectant transport system ATP-binding protein